VLLHLLNSAIDIARIEAGEFELEIAPFDLRAMVDAAACLYRPSALAKGLWFDVAIAPEALGTYRGDVVRLCQILQNFVANAVKFTESGGVAVKVARLDEHGERVRLRFDVVDTGVGLGSDAERLFRRYEQGQSSRRREGAGLGLAICRELATMMDAAVRARPHGGGASFELEISLDRAAAALAPAAAPYRPLAGARILAVEDNEMNRVVLKTLLEQAGLTVELAEDGAQAVEAARVRAFDAIVMDVHMPRLDGLTAARMIRSASGPNQRVPIVALTADAAPAHVRACLDAGMTGHVAKPIAVDALFAALAEALAQSPQTAHSRAAG
jgi:CheY-like chemotaxis protein